MSKRHNAPATTPAGRAGGPAGRVERGRHRVTRPVTWMALATALLATAAAVLLGPGLSSAATATPTPTATASTTASTTAPATTASTAPPAAAGRSTCDQYGSFPVAGGKYVVQNDRWGAVTDQCLTGFDTGFTVTKALHTNNTGPAGYPSIYRGCNFGYCTAGSPFPAPVATLGALRSSWSTTGPTAVGTQQYNTAYDLWFDPTKTNPGRNTGAELMVWLNRTPWVQPLGRHYYDTTIAGRRWQVWYGQANPPVISYVQIAPTRSVSNLALDAFVRDATLRGVVKPAWYLTSVQAGFEPWTGGTGLSTTSFSVTRNGS